MGAVPGGITLALGRAKGTYVSPPMESDIPFHFAGIYWSGSWAENSAPSFWLRTSPDGVHWGDWQLAQIELPPGPAAKYENYASLIGADGHRQVQFKVEMSGAAPESILRSVGLTLLNPYDGPLFEPASSSVGVSHSSESRPNSDTGYVVLPKPLNFSRESWGCDENLRFSSGQEVWPRDYVPVKALVVHHTVTPNDYSSVAEAMAHIRSVYSYHTVTQGWGDIGYNCIIDKFGNSYEGRRGRDGPGYDGPGGREFLSQDVVAGHALVYNHGTSGVALLGTFCAPGECPGQAPSGAMISRLVDVLAFECGRHGIHPQRSSTFLIRNGGWHPGLPNIVGHRDVGETSCPGGHTYGRLAEIRAYVADRLIDNAAPVVGITVHPPEGVVHDNRVQFHWVASGAGPLEFAHYLEGWRQEGDGSVTYIHGFTPDKWPAWSSWSSHDSAEYFLISPGLYTFHLMARDSAGRVSRFHDTRSFIGQPVGQPEGALFQGSGPQVYQLRGGLKREVPNAHTFAARGFNWGSINKVPDGYVHSLPFGRPLLDVVADGNLMRGSGPAVFVMEGGTRRHVDSAGVMASCGYGWDAIYVLPDSLLGMIAEGHTIHGPPCPHLSPSDGALIKGSGPAIFLMQRGLRRRVPNALTFEALGLHWGNVDTIADSTLAEMPSGQPVLDARADGNLLKSSGPALYVMEAGHKRHVVSAAVMAACGYGWDAVRLVSEGPLAALPTGSPLTAAPGPVPLPSDGSLIKGVGASVYVMDNAKRRHIPSIAIFEGCHYEWGNVSTIADSSLALIPSGPALTNASCPAPPFPDGTLLKGSGPAVYVIEGARRRHIVSVEVFNGCHYDWHNVVLVSDNTLSSIPLGTPLTTHPCP
jgi:hypothetical protein